MTEKPIIIICGLLGTGKTTVSKFLETKLKNYHGFNTDDVRRILGKKTFTRKDTPEVNRYMYTKARELIRKGKHVMFDSAYKTEVARQRIYDIGNEFNIPVLVFECTCNPETAKERIAKRKDRNNIYGATNDPRVYDRYVKLFQKTTQDIENGKNPHVSIIKWDTEKLKLERIRVNEDCEDILSEIVSLLSNKKFN